MDETGERLVRWEREHVPDREKHALYRESREKWQAVYQEQLGLVDHGLTTLFVESARFITGDRHD